MNPPLFFQLKVLAHGTEADGVTVKRLPYVSIESTMGPFSQSDFKQIQQVLDQNHIHYSTSDFYAFSIEVDTMFQVIRLLEADGWRIQDHVPFFVWQTVKDAQDIEHISDDVLAQKVGHDIWQRLHPFQRTAVKYVAERKSAYIADEMGSGKTFESLASIKFFEHLWPVLIVCPSSLRFTWQAEICRWLNIDTKQVCVIKAAKDIAKIKPHQFLIISYALLHKPTVLGYLSQQYQVIIMDEAHYIKSRGSKRTVAALDIMKHAQVKIMLSGTPFNYPSEMYSQIKALYPQVYPRFFNFGSGGIDEVGKYFFAKRYCKPQRVRFRNREQWVFKGYENHEELNAVFNTFMIRRRKHEILTQLPRKNRICITLDPLSKVQEKKLAKLLTQDETKNADKYMESFRQTCQFKLPRVIHFVKEYIIEDIMTENDQMKIIIFMHHDIMRTALEELLVEKQVPYFLINGETPSQKRQEYVDAFQNTQRYRVALLSIKAASTGLTLTAASTVVFTEVLFGPDDHLQAEDRAHRIGQENQVNIFYCIQPKTTDDINFGMIRKKERESSIMLDGHANILATRRLALDKEDKATITHLFKPRSCKRKAEPDVANSSEGKRIRIVRSKPNVIKVLS